MARVRAGQMTATSEIVRRTRQSLLKSPVEPKPPARTKVSGGMKLALPNILERIRATPGKVEFLDDNPSRMYQCGIVEYEKGQYVKALSAWKRAAAAGSSEADFRIGLLYARGEGVVRSMPDAVVWYERAADKGHVEAQYWLGTIYFDGAKPGPSSASQWFESASQRDGEAARRTLKALFPNGIAVEQNLRALCAGCGRQRTPEWLRPRPDWAICIGAEFGLTQDYEFARDWYLLAADRGKASAQFGLGDIYYQGLGVAVDLKPALTGMRRPPIVATREDALRLPHAISPAAAGRLIENRPPGYLFRQQNRVKCAACIKLPSCT